MKIMSCFILFAKDSRKITKRQLEFSQKRTIGSTKNKTTTIFVLFLSSYAGITITKNYLRKKYIDSGRDRAFLNLVSLVRSCVGSLAAVFFNFCLTLFFRQIVMRRTRVCQNASLWRLVREGRVTSLRRDNY